MGKTFDLLKSALTLVLILVAFVATAQTAGKEGTLRGFITDANSKEPVLFAAVYLEGTNFSTQTDVNGYYSITKIPYGTYTVVISSVETEELRKEVVIERSLTSRNYEVTSKTYQVGTAEVSTSGGEQKNQVRISVESIQPQDIKKIPSFGGTPDLVQVLQVLPGFVSTGDQGGQLYIRGGSPVQNKVLLDGMIVYNPFHSIGLFSVFDTDIIRNADIYTGGFNAEYGGRISSVMDITTRNGSKTKFGGAAGISPFGARLLLEGPLRKAKEGKGTISYLFSGKQSYLDQTSKILYNYVDDEGLPFQYQDIYGKVSFAGPSGSSFNVFGFNFSDQVNYQAVSDLNWNNAGGGFNFVVVPSGSPVLIDGNFSVSDYRVQLVEEGLPERFSQINGFNFGLNFKYLLGESEFKYGIQAVGRRTDFQTFNALGVKVEQIENTTEMGIYMRYKYQKGNLIIEPSFRAQYYASLAKLSPEPRLGIKYKVNEIFRLKAAAGIYTQNLIAANSDRDVVNLFYGFLAGPENLQDEFLESDGSIREIEDPLQRAQHLIAGFEYDLTERLNLNVEGYYKRFSQLTNTNRNKLFADNIDNQDVPETLRKDFIVESGFAQGVDVVLKYETKETYLWFVYSLGNVDRWDSFQWYDPVFDRRHNVNFVASQAFGQEGEWELNARWNLGSGLPFTQTQGFYQPVEVDGGVGSDPLTDNPGDLGISYAGLNEGRLPVYHRMDLSVRRTFTFSEDSALEITAGVTNVYSRENVFYVNRVTNEVVNQLPILPSIGLDFTF
ncbi:MAG: TonB-dependent receptor [Flavobacteriales bacterium]